MKLKLRWPVKCFLFLTAVLVFNPSVRAEIQIPTIRLKDVTLNEVFKEIRKQMDYTFVYDEEVVVAEGKVSVDITSADIREVMDLCLKGTKLTYVLRDWVVIIKPAEERTPLLQEEKKLKVSGLVVDENGEPMPGVTVVLKGSTIGGATDVDGKFGFEIPLAENMELEFSFVGFEKKTIKLQLKDNKIAPLRIVMKEETVSLHEVVVTGMFTRKKEGYTGSAVRVSGEDIKKMTTTNIAKAISVMEPGFRIMDNIAMGSDPNRLPDMRMRGQSTLPSGSSASSVDAVALQGEYDTYPNQPLLILDGFEIDVRTMVDLDPGRIASVTLLKDASATAIYGSKAANGVIVIETHMPKEGEINVSYGGDMRFEIPDLTSYNLMEADDKIQAEYLAGLYKKNDLDAMRDYQSRLREVKRGVNTYWLSKPLNVAVQQRHALTLEGGSRALRYKLYAGINYSPGVMKKSSRNTQTVALDLSYRYKNFIMKNSITVDNGMGKNSPYGSFSTYTSLNPYLRPYGENGEIVKIMQTWNQSYKNDYAPYLIKNPLYNTVFHTLDRNSFFGVRNLFKLEYRPVESLSLQADIAVKKATGKSEIFKPAQHTDFEAIVNPEDKGRFDLEHSEQLNYTMNFTVSYNGSIRSTHYLTGNMRYSLGQTQSMANGSTATGFMNDAMDNILYGKKYYPNIRGSEGTSRFLGFVLTLGYSYLYKYSVDFNMRIDGSSQFGSDNRFAPFWSTGLKWNLKKENFLSGLSWMDDLNISTTYGLTGTQGFAPYQAQSVYTYMNLMRPYVSSDASGAELVALGNTQLKWQQTATWNTRLEYSLFDGRLTGRVEYYHKNTKNSLAHITLAPSLGFGSYPENMGTQEGRGQEFTLSGIPYRDRTRDAYWVVSLNGSRNKDKLVKISQALKHMNSLNTSREAETRRPLPQYVEGESLSRIWLVPSLGIDPATGDELLVRQDGSLTGLYDAVDKRPMGNTEPQWQGNINTSFNYKGFGINLSFTYKFGGQIFNQTLMDKVENADLRYNADKRVLNLRWKNPGDVARFKRLTNSDGGAQSMPTSRFLMDENVLRMNTLSLTYRLEQADAGFMKKWPVHSMKFGFTMEDVFYFSSVKKERGLDYPFARQFALSLNVVFK